MSSNLIWTSNKIIMQIKIEILGDNSLLGTFMEMYLRRTEADQILSFHKFMEKQSSKAVVSINWHPSIPPHIFNQALEFAHTYNIRLQFVIPES